MSGAHKDVGISSKITGASKGRHVVRLQLTGAAVGEAQARVLGAEGDLTPDNGDADFHGFYDADLTLADNFIPAPPVLGWAVTSR